MICKACIEPELIGSGPDRVFLLTFQENVCQTDFTK